MTQTKTMDAVVALIAAHHHLLQQIKELSDPAEREFQAAKDKIHAVRIKCNQLQKLADTFQAAISVEKMAEYTESKQVERQYLDDKTFFTLTK